MLCMKCIPPNPMPMAIIMSFSCRRGAGPRMRIILINADIMQTITILGPAPLCSDLCKNVYLSRNYDCELTKQYPTQFYYPFLKRDYVKQFIVIDCVCICHLPQIPIFESQPSFTSSNAVWKVHWSKKYETSQYPCIKTGFVFKINHWNWNNILKSTPLSKEVRKMTILS